MSLYLVESVLNEQVSGKEAFEKKVDDVQEKLSTENANLIEVQVSKDLSRVFFIIESDVRDNITNTLRELNISVTLIKAVRLVGKDLEDVKKQDERINYLVEWNLPENLSMDQYLERKKKNSVHYDEVPEVSFSRTYVCEDMTKCLCFYDAEDEDSVLRARDAVKAPVDRITEMHSDK